MRGYLCKYVGMVLSGKYLNNVSAVRLCTGSCRLLLIISIQYPFSLA